MIVKDEKFKKKIPYQKMPTVTVVTFYICPKV